MLVVSKFYAFDKEIFQLCKRLLLIEFKFAVIKNIFRRIYRYAFTYPLYKVISQTAIGLVTFFADYEKVMLFGWGANSYGQLGLGTFTEQETQPTPINIENSFTKITGIRLEFFF